MWPSRGWLRRAQLSRAVVVVALVAGCTAPIDGRLPSVTVPRPVLQGDYDELFVDPDGPAARWVSAHGGHPDAELIERRIARIPAARWVVTPAPAVMAEVRAYVDAAERARRQPVLVADGAAALGCGVTATGPAVAAYSAWFTDLAKAVGARSAVVVIRDGWPDGPGCPADLRPAVMSSAVEALRAHAPQASVLLDGSRLVTDGSSSVSRAATQLASWSARDVTGIALNLGGYAPSAAMVATAKGLREALHAATGRSDYYIVVDSSKNGGAARGSCNPEGAKLGGYLTLGSHPEQNQDLWLTTPGVSDGPCGLAPDSVAGQFVPDLAVRLIA